MDLEPKAGPARRSRGWALVAWTLVAGVLGAGEAWADIHVSVMNCSAATIYVQTYNAKDSVKAVPYSKKTINAGQSATLSCEGQGKGYCQTDIGIDPGGCQGTGVIAGDDKWFNLNSGTWNVVTGGKLSDTNCRPVVEQDLASAPSKCP